MKKIVLATCACVFLLIISCTREHDGRTDNDDRIEEILEEKGISLESFQMPLPDDLNNIPQSIDNPLSKEKIELGASIFWDPVFHLNTMSNDHLRTATCGSCHIVDGHAGRSQGLGEGGLNTGNEGEGRGEDPLFYPDIELRRSLIDAQKRRPPTNMNVAYKTNTLWDGALGSPNLDRFLNIENLDYLENHNEGISFEDQALADLNSFPGFTGAEVQALAGLQAHRYRFNEQIVEEAGYKDDFDRVFGPNGVDPIVGKFTNNGLVQGDSFLEFGLRDRSDPLNDDAVFSEEVPLEYSRLAAALAVAAYNRHVLSNEAPFQKYVHGDVNGMSEQQKRGFILFCESGCMNCHTGPALTDADFHAVGTEDLTFTFGDNPIAGDCIELEGRDAGRFGVTGRNEDRFKFLTPTLYNIPQHVFHGGQSGGAPFAVTYMASGNPQDAHTNIDELWQPANLSTDELSDLIEFVENGLRDTNFEFKYRPGNNRKLLPQGLYSSSNTIDGGMCDPIFSPNNDAGTIANPVGAECNGCVNCP